MKILLVLVLTFLVAFMKGEVKVNHKSGLVKSRQRRDTVGIGPRRWPGGIIPYQFSMLASARTRRAFKIAIGVIQSVSCVKFVERKYERDYVLVITGKGCYSMIGRQGGRQYLSLGDGCYRKGVAVHETMHLVGFFHEQSRLDRDEHVLVHYTNVLTDAKRQFMKYKRGQGDTLGAKYDPDSIMHYSNKAFTKNGQHTITYRKDKYKRLGKRDSLSNTDVTQLNKLYECTEKEVKKEKKPPSKKGACEDDFTAAFTGQCILHLFVGNCYRQRTRMQHICKKTCGFCRVNCYDTADNCSFFAFYGFCHTNVNVQKQCKKTCRLC